MTETETRLHRIVEKVARRPVDPEIIERGAAFQEIGLDSLALAELVVRIEQEFGVDVFSDGVISTLQELKDRIGIGQHD